MGLHYGDWEERGNFIQCYLGSSRTLDAKNNANNGNNWKIEAPNPAEPGTATVNYKKAAKD
jgi:hypothetical protein